MTRALIFAVAFWIGWASAAFSHDYVVTIHRWIDADTFDGDLDVGVGLVLPDQRFRLMCIDAPESRGRDRSPEGEAMAAEVQGLALSVGTVELVERDAFGRWLAWLTPAEWDQTFNLWLYDAGAPLYDRLTRAERAECERRLQ